MQTNPIMPKGQAGFTLIEAMVVVVLVAILAALATPSFSTQIANQRVTAAAQELQVLLQFARAEAVYKRTPTSATPSKQTWEVKVDEKVLREAQISDSVTVSPATEDGVAFDVTGTARPGAGTAPYVVQLSASNATRVECLSVMGAGMVRLHRKDAGATCP